MKRLLRLCRRPRRGRRMFVFTADRPRRIDRVIDFFGDRRPGAATVILRRPKQYVPLIRADSLLRQTMGRAARLSPRERTLVVSRQHHSGLLVAGAAARPRRAAGPGSPDRGNGALTVRPTTCADVGIS
jgi:hypothetical protein